MKHDPAREGIGRRRFVTLMSQLWLAAPVVSALLVGCGGDSEEQAATDGAGDADDRRAAMAEDQRTREKQMAETKAKASEQAAQAGMAESEAPGEDALVTEIPAMASLVKSVNYQHETPKPDRRCDNCQLYTAKTDELGSCKLFAQGLVEAGGWCTSWIKKANAA